MLRLVIALAAAWLALLAAQPAPPGSFLQLDVRPVPLDPTHPEEDRVGRLRYMGGLWLEADDIRFGGLSDLRVSEQGTKVVAVSDCGSSLTGTLRYDDKGRLVGVDAVRLRPLAGPGGRPLLRAEVDAEGLAHTADNSFVVGFEGQHRLWRYPPAADPLTSSPVTLSAPRAAAALPFNEGLESVVALADGRLLILAEGVQGGRERTVGWIARGEEWDGLDFPLLFESDAPTLPFRPTGAALLPSGDVLVVERRWPTAASRLRLITAKALENRSDLTGTEIARFGPPMTLDNYEGVEAAPGPDGRLRIYLLSDDNDCSKGSVRAGASLQRTLLLSFVLAD